MLTMFIIPCDDKEASDFDRAEKSISEIADKVIELPDHNVGGAEKHNDWFGYIYSNEYFDNQLLASVPIYLSNGRNFDYLVMYKRILFDDSLKMFQSPRIFKSDVILFEGQLIPKEPELFLPITVLDGWILENNHVGI